MSDTVCMYACIFFFYECKKKPWSRLNRLCMYFFFVFNLFDQFEKSLNLHHDF